ncbi:hypothetical protein AB6A40_006119 [Gnathostoma spinigerum]|uniref:Wbp11/ELF5/Saf1 N-terminal domain-containing protein n=1 Tax=Gnathostoma spinigerum TaxID=75299 RepID=A0ABD6ET33_9BILA
MGRRPGSTTKSGRFMNPADQERKSMRQKELKRNRKQRTMVRHAILKSKDVDEIIENLKKLDDQEFDIHVEYHSKYVFSEKRAKFKQTFNEVMSLYEKEKRDDKIKELQSKMEKYEAERSKKIQQYNAMRFSLEANPVEIPLPDGSSVPNAAMTPATPSIPSQYLMPQARGILKRPRTAPRDVNERTSPPGPPCGLPPKLTEDEDEISQSKRRVHFGGSETQVIAHEFDDGVEEDLEPVEIPAEVMQQSSGSDQRPMPVLAPNIPQTQPLLRAPPLPPNMLPPPPRLPLRMPPPPPNFGRPGMPPMPFMRPPAGDSVISAEPMVKRPSERSAAARDDGAEATISAAPKLRDLTKEVTKFIPVTLRVHRNHPQPKRSANRYNMMGVHVESAQRKEAKDTDEAYADFMKEMSSLL